VGDFGAGVGRHVLLPAQRSDVAWRPGGRGVVPVMWCQVAGTGRRVSNCAVVSIVRDGKWRVWGRGGRRLLLRIVPGTIR